MTDRINYIVSFIPECETFADIGCDHGYVSYEMLKMNKCKSVIYSDISEKCLKKAKTLLAGYEKLGLAKGVVCDGFDPSSNCDLALISGMGGKEIIKILSNRQNLPNRLVLSPQKNIEEVRLAVVGLGFCIDIDKTFYADSKFYDIMLLSKGIDKLTKDEIMFGRTNILEKGKDFIAFLEHKKESLKSYLVSEKMSQKNREKILKLVEEYERYAK